MLQRVLERYPDAKVWQGDKIVDEDVLIEFLQGCDAATVAMEPITDRVLATPHIGAAAAEIRIQMVDAATRGLTENELVDPAKYYNN